MCAFKGELRVVHQDTSARSHDVRAQATIEIG
jgi:hypothetical protein